MTEQHRPALTTERVMGIETEYGIAVQGDPRANPMAASGEVVTTYARAHGLRAGHGAWDYSDEHPLVDARGFEMPRARADISQLTDAEDPTLANVVLANGARLYVDHAHPEYSSPEVTSPRDVVVWDRAGELVMREVVERLADSPPGINLYKNNTDGKGASYGTHENYLVPRSIDFDDLTQALVPLLVVRPLLVGSGRVGTGAADLLVAMGVPVTRWDMAETAHGGPFPEVLAHDLFINAILAQPGAPVFVPATAVAPGRRLTVIGDVACDPDGPYNPVPVYDHITSWASPAARVADNPPLDVMAIDNLPSMLPRESSEDYAGQLLPVLSDLDRIDDGAWGRAGGLFDKHAKGLTQT